MGSRGRLPQGRFHVLPDPQSAPCALSVRRHTLTCIISFGFGFLVSTTAAKLQSCKQQLIDLCYIYMIQL